MKVIRHPDGRLEFLDVHTQQEIQAVITASASVAKGSNGIGAAPESPSLDTGIGAPEFISQLQSKYEGKTITSEEIATLVNMKGVQGVGPFMWKIENELQREGLELRDYVLKVQVLGKPTTWKVLTEAERRKIG